MPETKRPLKVFLCHAHADRDPVRALHTRLTKGGVDVWLDNEKLLPGQDWELEIRKAVRQSDVVVVCLSKQFNQAGFRQKEVRLALDTAMEQPEGEIFIIPARLEECDTLESLRKWHRVDLFESDGYEGLMRTLRVRAEKINASLHDNNDVQPTTALMNFVYGRPVRPKEFLGRESELLTIFNRLRNKESTAIVGEPHIGKTSLLLLIDDRDTQEHFLKNDAKKMVVTLKDLQPVSAEYTPSEFWQEALTPLRDKPGHSSITTRLNEVKEQGYSNRSLNKLFQNIADRGQTLVLLLDEFDRLLSHPNFKDPSFFAGMRSLSTITGGLVLITSSRLTLAEMNVKGHELLGGNVNTSPFFNNFIEVKLRPFTFETVTQLLQRVPDTFTSQEISFIRRVAGRHPYLLQAMAATLYETPAGVERQIQAAEMFYSRINFHFDTLWNSLDDKAKTTAVILSLMDLDGYSAGSNFSYGEIENANAFDAELKSLAYLGLAEKIQDGQKIDLKHGLIWQGEKWTIGAQAFTWWVRDVVISKSRKLKEFDEWLADKRYRLFLTEQQWTDLTKLVKSTPEFLTKGVTALAKSIIKEITGMK